MMIFVGLPVPRQMEKAIGAIQQNKAFGSVLRVPRMGLHVTQKAPQEVDEELLDEWIREAEIACRGVASLELRAINLDFITTVSLALMLEPSPFRELHENLNNGLKKFNAPGASLHEGNRFQPHITVGKRSGVPLPSQHRQRLVDELNVMLPRPPGILVSVVRLYGKNDGPYRVLKDIALA